MSQAFPHPASATGTAARRISPGGFCLGFAIGGFFDGILLHQILQWHHLLSGLEGEAYRDLRVQVLADGLFHLFMYVLGLAGLWLLWRGRGGLAAPGADRGLLAAALLGFGAWHLLDAVLSHWLLGLHRIRMDTANPLLWDIGWLLPFGLLPLLAGWMMHRRPGGGGGPGMRRAVPLALVAATLLAGPLAALPPRGDGTVAVLFRPGTTPDRIFAGFDAIGARPLWTDRSGEVWLVAVEGMEGAWRLYRHGALLVGGGASGLGCFSWSRAAG